METSRVELFSSSATVVGRTLWVMVLQFVCIMQNAGAVLILHQECDCDCKNFQCIAQCYWGLLSVSLTLGSCFDTAIRYVSNRCVLVAINKTLEVTVCLGFAILQFIYLTLIFMRVFHEHHGDDPSCRSEHDVKRYFALQLFAALAAFVTMVFIVLEKVYMKCFCPSIPTHIWFWASIFNRVRTTSTTMDVGTLRFDLACGVPVSSKIS